MSKKPWKWDETSVMVNFLFGKKSQICFFLFFFLQKTAKFGKIAKKGVSKMVKTLNVFGVSRYFEIGLKFTLIGPKKVEPTRKLLLNASKMAKRAQNGPKKVLNCFGFRQKRLKIV